MKSSEAAYKSLIIERKNEITKEMEKLEKRKNTLKFFDNIIDVQISTLQAEYNKLDEEEKDYKNREKLSNSVEKTISLYDEQTEINNQKKKEYNDIIKKLKATQTRLSSDTKIKDTKKKNLKQMVLQ